MSIVNAYLLSHRPKDNWDHNVWFAPRIKCSDGFSLSVQVHFGAYCSPRDGIGPDWSTAEIGYPSERPTDEVMAHAEDPETPTDTVYGHVPMYLIDQLVELHGGIAKDQP